MVSRGRHEAGIAGARRMVRCGAHALIAFGLGLASLPVVWSGFATRRRSWPWRRRAQCRQARTLDTTAARRRSAEGMREPQAAASATTDLHQSEGHWVSADRSRDVRTRRRGIPVAEAAAPRLPSWRRLIHPEQHLDHLEGAPGRRGRRQEPQVPEVQLFVSAYAGNN